MPSWLRCRRPSAWAKALEDMLVLVGGDADAGVPDDEIHGVGGGARFGLEADLPAFGRELDGVVEQALEHLGQGGGVARDGEIGRSDVHGDALMFLRRLVLLGGGADIEQVGQLARLGMQLDLAG